MIPATFPARNPGRRGAILALLGGACMAPAAASRGDRDFDAAVGSYRAGRYSEAFGRLLALAFTGDADASRIVLFMHQYGPQLYGAYWDLSPHDMAAFEEAGGARRLRKHPPFQPEGSRPARAGRK